jgi:hypothetical protein
MKMKKSVGPRALRASVALRLGGVRSGRPGALCATASVAALLGFAGEARAIEINTGNPDVQLTWGNTVRYNIGMRVNKRDDVIGNSPNTDEGDYRFDKNDLVTNRIDLLSELDLNYKRKMGLRLSAAAWGDAAYDGDSRTNPALANRGSYIGNRYSNYTKRYFKGPSGEILDAYGFWNFDAGSMSGNVKVGRHTVLWGEALALSAHSVSYAQAPTDGLKALATPGVDAKETALPVGQISGSLQVTPELAFAAQYYFEWQPTRVAEGGTYLGGTDFILRGPDRFSLAPGRFLANQGIEKPRERGDFGLSARWKPTWLDGTVGAYYRVFDERSPTISLNVAGGTYRAVYPENAKLVGLSYATSIGGMSTGVELVHRRRTALNSSITDGAPEGARGNTWHALFNTVAVVGPNKLWDQLTVTGELAYSRLSKVTSGQQYFLDCAKRPAGDQGAETGCVTKDAWQAFLRVSPSWAAVWPGWDVSALASLSLGLKGNSAVLGGGNEKAGSYSLGMTFTYNQRHDFSIAYNDYLATREVNPATGLIRVSNGSQIQDRGWLSLTYKGSF